MRKSFIVHKDSLEVLEDLTDEQAGQLFKAIKSYQLDEELDLSSLIKVAFAPFKCQFARDADKYEKLCEKNRLIAVNRHKPNVTKSTSGNEASPTVTKSTDNDSKSDSKSKSDRSNILADREFEEVWDLYGKKGNKKPSKLKYSKLSATNKAALLSHIPNYVLSTPEKQYRKDFQTYLNQEAWNDEITQSTAVAQTESFVEKHTNKSWHDEIDQRDDLLSDEG